MISKDELIEHVDDLATIVERQIGVIGEIVAERNRQIEKEGWSHDHDDKNHIDGALARLACMYANPIEGMVYQEMVLGWEDVANLVKRKDPRRNLVIAGALIVAEIERMDRAKKAEAA